MKRMEGFQYGPVAVMTYFYKDEDVDVLPSNMERYQAFFKGAPVFGGHEWKTLGIDEIVSIFQGAAKDILEMYKQQHDIEVQRHSARNFLMRWWEKFRGWEAPHVQTYQEIVQGMIQKCKKLSEWTKNYSEYYDTNMEDFMHKPEAVAKCLGGI